MGYKTPKLTEYALLSAVWTFAHKKELMNKRTVNHFRGVMADTEFLFRRKGGIVFCRFGKFTA